MEPGTLDRPIEEIISTLVQEMVHYLNCLRNIQDCSRGGTYHNRFFKEAAEAHGLHVAKSEKYGWSITSPSDLLIEWILLNDLADIRLSRNEFAGIRIGGGQRTANGGGASPPPKSNSRRYACPLCHMIIRATRDVNVICGDCMEPMGRTS